ncbi:class I SAM-dependent methyltransferase [Scytonema sp. NUACC26]|uniref:class I SAM-dependent methyltransferase n=1 Tax=Scytonema sp. NUACC26 TaxID=3140176 RepID=UPI0034DC5849
MIPTTRYSEYDTFARIINESWGPQSSDSVLSDVEQLLLQHLPEKAHVLDLCCGAGHLAQKLQNKGYQVTGIDGSADLLRHAFQNAPDSKFILDDARFFKLPSMFHGVVSTGYGLNHIIKLEELLCTFKNVYATLLSNGLFMFDLRLDKMYQGTWNNSTLGDVKEDYAWALKRQYNPEERIGQINITQFQLVSKNWQRLDNTWLVRGYFKEEVMSALKNVGFTEVNDYNVERDLADSSEASTVYFVCHK